MRNCFRKFSRYFRFLFCTNSSIILNDPDHYLCSIYHATLGAHLTWNLPLRSAFFQQLICPNPQFQSNQSHFSMSSQDFFLDLNELDEGENEGEVRTISVPVYRYDPQSRSHHLETPSTPSRSSPSHLSSPQGHLNGIPRSPTIISSPSSFGTTSFPKNQQNNNNANSQQHHFNNNNHNNYNNSNTNSNNHSYNSYKSPATINNTTPVPIPPPIPISTLLPQSISISNPVSTESEDRCIICGDKYPSVFVQEQCIGMMKVFREEQV